MLKKNDLPSRKPQISMEVLSKRERQIAELITLGLSESEIAAKLFLSTSTVHNHAANIRKKINARSAVDVARSFILSLENPRRYFSALALALLHIVIVFNHTNVQLRRPPSVKTVRTVRRYNSI